MSNSYPVDKVNKMILDELLLFTDQSSIENIKKCIFQQFGETEFLQAFTQKDVKELKADNITDAIKNLRDIFHLYYHGEIGFIEKGARIPYLTKSSEVGSDVAIYKIEINPLLGLHIENFTLTMGSDGCATFGQ